MSQPEKTATEIGEMYIATHYPDFETSGKSPSLSDEGDYWQYTYELPADMIGGAPVVVIDKDTFEVLRAYRTQ